MRTWKRFWSLSRRDRSAALEAAVMIAATRVGLRAAGYRRWRSMLSRLSGRNVQRVRDPRCFARDTSPDHFARIAASAARNLFFRSTCLERSFGLWWVLRRRGFDAALRIGGRKTGERFEAHAWVEYAGIPLSDPGDEHDRFSVFGDSDAVAARQLH
jgi:Transglutaminase-like superfamily